MGTARSQNPDMDLYIVIGRGQRWESGQQANKHNQCYLTLHPHYIAQETQGTGTLLPSCPPKDTTLSESNFPASPGCRRQLISALLEHKLQVHPSTDRQDSLFHQACYQRPPLGSWHCLPGMWPAVWPEGMRNSTI